MNYACPTHGEAGNSESARQSLLMAIDDAGVYFHKFSPGGPQLKWESSGHDACFLGGFCCACDEATVRALRGRER